jgi:poly-beta-hydroxybutyrate-responsive repressor
MEERVMNNEEQDRDVRGKEREFRGVEARPRNWLVPVILLSLREWNSYGYELMERASAFGFEAMNPGTLYRTLRQMEKEGIVESSWETSRGGPARRMYTPSRTREDHTSTSGPSRWNNTSTPWTTSSGCTLAGP